MGMPAGYHHLYEYGTCGVFSALGRPTLEPGSPTSGPARRRTMKVCWTFDERTEDGLAAWFALKHFRDVLEDPQAAGAWIAAPGAVEPPEGVDARGEEPVGGAALS
jgi:hypothetical protein